MNTLIRRVAERAQSFDYEDARVDPYTVRYNGNTFLFVAPDEHGPALASEVATMGLTLSSLMTSARVTVWHARYDLLAEREKAQRATAMVVRPAAPAPQVAQDITEADDEVLVHHVLSYQNMPFMCLGFAQLVDKDTVGVRFKKLALRLHPDKLHHPQASECFRLIRSAYTRCLDVHRRRAERAGV